MEAGIVGMGGAGFPDSCEAEPPQREEDRYGHFERVRVRTLI